MKLLRPLTDKQAIKEKFQVNALSNGWKQWCKEWRRLSSWLQFLAARKLSEPAHARLSTALAGWICEGKPAPQPSQPFEIWYWKLFHFLPIKPIRCFVLCVRDDHGHTYPYVEAWNQGWNQGWCQPAGCIPHHLTAAPKRTGGMNILFADTAIRLQQKLCWFLVPDSMRYGKTTQPLTISIPITRQLTYKSHIY